MRSGFVIVSLMTHAAIVALAAQHPAPSRPTPQQPRVSGLVALELTQQVPARVPRAQGASASPPPTLQRPPSAAEALETKTAAAAPEKPKPPAPDPPGKSRAPLSDSAPQEEPKEGDWLSIDQQLPDTPRTQKAPAPPPDRLVERLLAKERDRQHILQREERRRTARMQALGNDGETSSAGVGADLPTEHEVVGGENHAEADVWVELTRWLPRAASSDRAWDALAPSTRVAFEVELTTENGRLTHFAAKDDALPSYVRRLLAGTRHLMRRGHFGPAERAQHAFQINIHLSDTEARELRIAHTVPDPPAPGQGILTLPSGRRFDAYVTAIRPR